MMNPIEHQFRQLAFAQVLLGMVSFCVAEGQPLLLAVVGVLAIVSWFVTEGPMRLGLDRQMLNLGAVGAVVLMSAEAMASNSPQPVSLVGHFTIALQLVLLFSKKNRREYIQLAVLSPLQMISASVLPGGVTLIYGLLLLAYCFVTLLTALSFQLKSAHDLVHQRHVAGAQTGRTPARPEAISGPRYRLHLRASAVVLSLVCGLIAATVFLITPRSRQDPFAAALVSQGTSTQSRAGFNERIKLAGGSIGGGSPDPVLNVTIMQDGESIGSEDKSWLIRGAVQDAYDPRTKTWSRPPITGTDDVVLKMPDSGIWLAANHSKTREAAITLRRRAVHNLFTVINVGGPVAPIHLHAPGISQISFSTEDQQIDSNDALASVLRYRLTWCYAPGVDLRPVYRQRLRDLDLHGRFTPARERQRHQTNDPDDVPITLDWPVETERVRAYAQRVLRARGLADDYSDAGVRERKSAVYALSAHLRYSFRYTLDNPQPDDDTDPVIAFLFQTRAGHCELFASGLAAMCRSVGIPARLATGYRASEYNGIGGYYVVRDAHAHAWTEADLGQGAGWHVFDATPASEVDLQHQADAGWMSQARALYDHLEFNWIATLITYDQTTQQQLLGSLGTLLSEGPDRWVADSADWVMRQTEQVAFDTVGRALSLLIALTLGVAIISLLRLLLLRHKRMVALQLTAMPRAQRRALARQLRFYVLMLETLERHGRSREHWQSPFQFARMLADEQPLCFEPVIPLTEMFYEVRFGYRELDQDRQSRIRLHLRRLEQNLASPSRV